MNISNRTRISVLMLRQQKNNENTMKKSTKMSLTTQTKICRFLKKYKLMKFFQYEAENLNRQQFLMEFNL
jgi:hypothetical protein